MEGKNIGGIGPDFTLRDQKKQKINLKDFRGKKVLLSFHPLAWTEICKLQMQALEENLATFRDLNTVPLGLSVDGVPCKAAWAEAINIENLSLPCDFWPHGGVAKKYGLFREADGFSERANVILDEEGRIIFFKIYEIKELPDINEIIRFLKK